MDRNPIVPAELTTLVNVALRKESVDRNVTGSYTGSSSGVALRKESVDRNVSVAIIIYLSLRRSPQGERG